MLIGEGIGRAPDVVLCTHLDQISHAHLKEQIATVAKVFWPASAASHERVFACSSRVGLGAYMLRNRSAFVLPKFKDIWNNDSLEYDVQCLVNCYSHLLRLKSLHTEAKEILGIGSPKPNYEQYTSIEWMRAIDNQLENSGLPETIARLTTDLVKKSQQRSLFYDGERIRWLLRKSNNDQMSESPMHMYIRVPITVISSCCIRNDPARRNSM